MKKIIALNLISLAIISPLYANKQLAGYYYADPKLQANEMLLAAASKGDISEVQSALKNGANLEMQNSEGMNAFEVALNKSFEHDPTNFFVVNINEAHAEIAKLLAPYEENIKDAILSILHEFYDEKSKLKRRRFMGTLEDVQNFLKDLRSLSKNKENVGAHQ